MEPNICFPALPNYTGPDHGLAGFVYHDKFFEYCWSFKERITYIHANKPAHEISTRDRCLVYLDPTGQPWETAGEAFGKARREAKKAEDAWWKAKEAEEALLIYAPQIEAQIRSLIPDLPWNGTALVFGEVR